MRSLVALLVVAGAAVGAFASGCAKGGHRSLDLGTASEADAGTEDSGTVANLAPLPVNTKLISDTALCVPGSPTVAWSPLRRISRVEYDNMVRDLLGDTTQPATNFVPESPMANGVYFETNTYTSVSTLVAQQYQQAAETLAQTAVASATTLAALLPCQTQDDACAQQFIASFANKAFRGQFDSTESSQLFQVYSDVKAQFDFPTGIQAVITAVLESPRFLYVFEFGQGTATGDVIALSPYEVAARLSLFLWRSVPDDTLMQAAAAGQLTTAAQVEAQAVRMLADTKAIDAIQDFTMQFLQLQGTPTLGKDSQFTTWTHDPQIGAEMQDETLTNVSQLVLTENGGLVELLTSPYSYVNSELASFYDTGIGSGTTVTVNDSALSPAQTTYVRTDLSSSNRAGILTNGAVMATQAHTSLPSSVLRGKLVREELLCDQLPQPPPGIPPPATSVPEGGTTRSISAAHENMSTSCFSCHQYLDPIGFGFGHFDATGAYQATDANGASGTFPPVDATGQITAKSPGEFATTFNGATDLVTQLAAAAEVQQCFVIQELRYALSRIETTDDACSAQQAFAAFSSSQLNIQKLLVALTGSDAFRYRSVETGGSACQ
ncbi:MAG: DUF1592 domain-containing protein [Polyangiaceae bacterium]